MKLDMFGFIDAAVDYINIKEDFTKYVSRECNKFFYELFEDEDYFLKSVYRIKTNNSIKEKLLRQNFFNKYNHPREVFRNLNDIIGVRIECRFSSDEKVIFEKIKDNFNQRDENGLFRSDLNENIYLDLSAEQPQYQKNGFEIYKIDGKFIDGEEMVHFELQVRSLVNVFWGEIDHRILYKNFNYMITEDFIRDMMYSIKSNLEMVDTQLNTIYNRLQNIESSNYENTKTQLKSILSKSVHDTYLLKLKNETGLLIDLRLISNLIIDFMFSKLDDSSTIIFNSQIIEVFDTINQLNRKKMTFAENIKFGEVKYRSDINRKLGENIENSVNKDFKWNICIKMIFDISKDDENEVFADFVNYIVHTISYRVEKGTENIDISKKDRHKLKYELLNEIIEFYCRNLDINYFNIEDMRDLQKNIEEFLIPVSKPEDLLDIDMKDFEKILEVQYKYNNRNIKSD